MKWRWSFAVVSAILLCANCSHHNGKTSFDIAIMTTAHLHSHVTPYQVKLGGETITVGVLERIASAARQVRSDVDAALLLSSGDDTLGPLYSLFRGEPEMVGMSLAGYQLVTPGNHEFDYGVDVYKNALNFAEFEVISANLIIDDPEVAHRIRTYAIREIAGVKIGIFGMMTPAFSKVCNPPGGGVSVNQDIVSVARDVVDELVSRQCDIIIALTHIGLDYNRQLAQEINDIDIIVGGHDHDMVHETLNNTIIVQDRSGGEYLGVLRFGFEDGSILDPRWETILLDSTVGYVPEIRDLMAKYMAEYGEKLDQKIGESAVDLDGRKDTLRSRESNLGNLVADSWLDWFKEADISLVNSGSIRGDTIYPAGPITYLIVDQILPFRNEVVQVELLGSDVKKVLEISASTIRAQGDGCEDENRPSTGGFLQVGALRFTIDLNAPPFCAVYSDREVTQILNSGSRILNVKVNHDGAWFALNPSASYTVLVNDFTAAGGDGNYLFLKEGLQKKFTTMISTDILSTYIQKFTPVSPQVEGRITFASK